jgi:hypothetical protein
VFPVVHSGLLVSFLFGSRIITCILELVVVS